MNFRMFPIGRMWSEAVQQTPAPANVQTAANVAAKDTPNVTLLKIERALTDPTITSLVLRRARVGVTGMKALARVLAECAWVTTLDITEEYMDLDAMVVLAEALRNNTTVTSLRLKADRMNEMAMTTLSIMIASNETLTSLEIIYTTAVHDRLTVQGPYWLFPNAQSNAATRALIGGASWSRRRPWRFLDLNVPRINEPRASLESNERENRELDRCTARRTLLPFLFWKDEAQESPHKRWLSMDGDRAVAARVLGFLGG